MIKGVCLHRELRALTRDVDSQQFVRTTSPGHGQDEQCLQRKMKMLLFCRPLWRRCMPRIECCYSKNKLLRDRYIEILQAQLKNVRLHAEVDKFRTMPPKL